MNTSSLLGTLTLTLALGAASTASAQEERHFLFSGDGVAPGVGRFAVELGGTLAFSGDAVGGIPTLGVRYARGITGPLDFRLSLNTLGLYNTFDAGLGLALVRGGVFGLGLRAGGTGMVVFTPEGDSGGTFAFTPGAVATLRGRNVAFSVGADVPMFLAGYVLTPSVSGTASGFIPAIRPNLALEIGGSADAVKF